MVFLFLILLLLLELQGAGDEDSFFSVFCLLFSSFSLLLFVSVFFLFIGFKVILSEYFRYLLPNVLLLDLRSFNSYSTSSNLNFNSCSN